MVVRYPALSLTRQQAWRARRNDGSLARVRLVALLSEKTVDFLLLADRAFGHEETWLDARSSGARPCLWAFEAIRQTSPGASSPVWTWRMKKDHFHRIESSIKGFVRRQEDGPLREFAESTKRWPGFSAVRRQHVSLGRLVAAEWRRSGRDMAEIPPWPRIRYVQRIKTNHAPRKKARRIESTVMWG